jgi:hypothetical protein
LVKKNNVDLAQYILTNQNIGMSIIISTITNYINNIDKSSDVDVLEYLINYQRSMNNYLNYTNIFMKHVKYSTYPNIKLLQLLINNGADIYTNSDAFKIGLTKTKSMMTMLLKNNANMDVDKKFIESMQQHNIKKHLHLICQYYQSNKYTNSQKMIKCAKLSTI